MYKLYAYQSRPLIAGSLYRALFAGLVAIAWQAIHQLPCPAVPPKHLLAEAGLRF